MYGHPIQNRQYLLEAAQDIQEQSERAFIQPNEDNSSGVSGENESHKQTIQKGKVMIDIRDEHQHGSGSMNMRALVLHVLGDALGNIGVIATGLIIWLTNWSFKFYCDPMISLIITAIIFSSAMPLGKDTVTIFCSPTKLGLLQ